VENKRLDLGVVPNIHAESFGEPGQRTFRLHADAGAGTVSLWLEKQQIVALLTATQELLERVPSNAGHGPRASCDSAFSGDLDVRVGTLAVGYDSGVSGFTLEAAEFETALDLTHIRLVAARSQMESMRDELGEIVGRSRPRCPMCGRPLTGDSHFCPQSNGHAHLSVES